VGLLHLAKESSETMSPEATVMDAVRLMSERRVGAVALTEGSRCVGMFTERDLVWRVVYRGKDAETTLLREVMTSPVLSVSDSTSVGEAAALMREHHIRHLAVVDPRGDFLGTVALRYLLYAMMDDLEAKVGDLEGYLMADAPGG
jgi:CBS domain-containing protein